MLDTIAREFSKALPEETAIITSRCSVSWITLYQKIEAYKKQLAELHSDRIAIYFALDVESIALLIASSCFPIEIILISSYFDLHSAEIFMQKFSATKLLRAKSGKIHILASQEIAIPKMQEPYICLLTSGTTDVPKCVKRAWNSLTKPIKIDKKYLTKNWMQCYPITHFAGMQNFLRCYLNGGCLVIPDDFQPKTAVEVINHYKIDFLNCTPTYMRQLLMLDQADKLSSLKHITLGGEIAQQLLLDRIKIKLPAAKLTHIYGSSELGMLIMVRDGKEGFPSNLIDNMHFRIINDELYVRSSSQAMIGYLDKKAITSDEWVATKDLVKITNQRCLFLGRVDDVINVGGYNVNPHMVESAIREIPEVIDVAVVAQKSHLVGNLIKAIVHCKDGIDTKKLEIKMVEHCRKHLPDYMVPRMIEFTNNLRLTETRKLLRRGYEFQQ